jgi:two-component system KDP operon response regulator KdpE
LKALVIEDRTTMSQMFCGILEKFGIEHKLSTTVSDALEEMTAYKPQIVILDSSVDRGTGMSFISAVTPVEEEKESRKERKKKIEDGPGILVIRTIYETVPTDCPFVKASLVRPFTAQQLTESIKAIVPKDKRAEAPQLYKEIQASNPEVELQRRGITYGESYVFFEERPVVIHQVMQIFSNAGYDMLLVTHLRAKVAREKFGLDKGAEVFTLSGSNYPLGTMITAVQDFLSKNKYPLVAIGDLDIIIEHCGLDMTMRAIQQMLSLRKTRSTKFTVLVSVDGNLLTQNVRGLLTGMMTEYNREE